ncbi:MAG: hypothetical protein FD123_3472 [Bacteroidetes bacterium]|nr:MAG: hypothetical protein FD123_3472 [Bacteroidota bacterium]
MIFGFKTMQITEKRHTLFVSRVERFIRRTRRDFQGLTTPLSSPKERMLEYTSDVPFVKNKRNVT